MFFPRFFHALVFLLQSTFPLQTFFLPQAIFDPVALIPLRTLGPSQALFALRDSLFPVDYARANFLGYLRVLSTVVESGSRGSAAQIGQARDFVATTQID